MDYIADHSIKLLIKSHPEWAQDLMVRMFFRQYSEERVKALHHRWCTGFSHSPYEPVRSEMIIGQLK